MVRAEIHEGEMNADKLNTTSKACCRDVIAVKAVVDDWNKCL